MGDNKKIVSNEIISQGSLIYAMKNIQETETLFVWLYRIYALSCHDKIQHMIIFFFLQNLDNYSRTI